MNIKVIEQLILGRGQLRVLKSISTRKSNILQISSHFLNSQVTFLFEYSSNGLKLGNAET